MFDKTFINQAAQILFLIKHIRYVLFFEFYKNILKIIINTTKSHKQLIGEDYANATFIYPNNEYKNLFIKTELNTLKIKKHRTKKVFKNIWESFGFNCSDLDTFSQK